MHLLLILCFTEKRYAFLTSKKTFFFSNCALKSGFGGFNETIVFYIRFQFPILGKKWLKMRFQLAKMLPIQIINTELYRRVLRALDGKNH